MSVLLSCSRGFGQGDSRGVVVLIATYQLLHGFTCVLGSYHSGVSSQAPENLWLSPPLQPRREIVTEAVFQLVKVLA